MESIQLPRSNPEEQGVLSSGILAFIDAVEKQAKGKRCKELHNFMLLRHGYVVAEGWCSPYVPERPHMLFSLSKSFTSTAIGLAISEGLLSVDDSVISFFSEDVPENISENLAGMKVRHLLSMSTGNSKDTMAYLHSRKDGNWVRGFFDALVEYAPGTHFLYNTGATYMLSAILQNVSGQKLIDYLRPRLFEPLGIENPTWETCPRGINTGGFGLSIKTEDIARFGQLYLQKGFWNGRQIVPQAWVEDAVSSQISNGSNPDSEWEQGYGYQFWRCRYNVYRGDGAFGQYCVVMPDQDAVIAINSGLNDMQAILNLFWEHLLPAMKDKPLPEDADVQKILKDRLASLMLPLPEGRQFSAVGNDVSGRKYILEQNSLKFKDITFVFKNDECTVTLQTKANLYKIRCGIGKRIEGLAPFRDRGMVAAVSGIWKDDAVFVIEMHFIETPFCITLSCSFDGDELRIVSEISVGFDENRRHSLKGTRA